MQGSQDPNGGEPGSPIFKSCVRKIWSGILTRVGIWTHFTSIFKQNDSFKSNHKFILNIFFNLIDYQMETFFEICNNGIDCHAGVKLKLNFHMRYVFLRPISPVLSIFLLVTLLFWTYGCGIVLTSLFMVGESPMAESENSSVLPFHKLT